MRAGGKPAIAVQKRSEYDNAVQLAIGMLPTVGDFWGAANRAKFPLFAAVLAYILPIPASSVARESLFSQVAHILGRRQQHLSGDHLLRLLVLSFDKWSTVEFVRYVQRTEAETVQKQKDEETARDTVASPESGGGSAPVQDVKHVDLASEHDVSGSSAGDCSEDLDGSGDESLAAQ